jgi:hypothetical protein
MDNLSSLDRSSTQEDTILLPRSIKADLIHLSRLAEGKLPLLALQEQDMDILVVFQTINSSRATHHRISLYDLEPRNTTIPNNISIKLMIPTLRWQMRAVQLLDRRTIRLVARTT